MLEINNIKCQESSPLILIVDDDIVMRLLLRRAMEQEGYKVAEVSDGKECLEAYPELKPNIILLDAMMPVMDGFTCCSLLQKLPGGNRTPVLIITGLDDPKSVDRAFDAGAIDYVTKPIHWAVLRHRVRRLLQASQAMEELRQQTEREQLIGMMQERIRQSLNINEILKTTVDEVRKFLATDRVIIYNFQPNGIGKVIVESVNENTDSIIDLKLNDACFNNAVISQHISNNYYQKYQQGRIRAIEDIYTDNLDSCYFDFLKKLQVISNLVVPILKPVNYRSLLLYDREKWRKDKIEELDKLSDIEINKQLNKNHQNLLNNGYQKNSIDNFDTIADTSNNNCIDNTQDLPILWGLLIAHHCSGPRRWHHSEIELLERLANQVAIAIKQGQLYQQLEEANLELQRLSTSDSLTRVANRRRFDQYLDWEWRRLSREKKPLSLILCDLDFFKSYNDTYGHQAGDACLQQVANSIQMSVKRPADLVARYGGEEFAIILPNTDAFGGLTVAEEIRQKVKSLKIPHAGSLVNKYVTLSLGLATIIPNLETSPEKLITTADLALYQAKGKGRDRVGVLE